MQPEKEIDYMFMDELKRYVYINEAGNVDFSAEIKPLRSSPDGWQTMSLSYERNMLRHGILRTASIPLKFIKDGAKILRYFYHKYGYEAKLVLIISKFNPFNYVSELFFRGDINFSTLSDETSSVTVEILDGGINADLKAKMTTPYEIDINPYRKIYHDGLKIKQKSTFAVTDSTNFIDDPYWRRKNHIVDMSATNQEMNPNFASTQSVQRFKTPASQVYGTRRWFLKAKVATTVNITYDFYVDISYDYSSGTAPTPGIGAFMDFRKYDATGTTFTNYLILNVGGSNIWRKHHLVGTLSIPMQKDEELYLHSRVNVIGVGGDDTTMWDYTDGGTIEMEFLTRAAATVVNGMTAEDLFDQLMLKINGRVPIYRSQLLASRKDIIIISGDALRGFPDAKIKITLDDFLKGMNTLCCTGFGTQYNQAILEKRRHFYQDIEAINLGEVKDYKITTATDLGYNQIKIGFPPFEYDEINGRDEPNTTTTWASSVTRIVETSDLVSPIRGDMYGAEFARVNYSQKKTTDNNSDNDNFFLICDTTPDVDGNYHLYRPAFDVITGLIQPDTAYNLMITPRRCMEEHGSWHRGVFMKKDTESLTYQTIDKNPLLHTEVGGVIVDEDSDIPIGQFADRYMELNYITIRTTTPVNMPDLLANLPFGFIKFTTKGVERKGWIIKADIQPHTLEEKEFKLLTCAGQDLNLNSNE